jgi:hypothetical protein
MLSTEAVQVNGVVSWLWVARYVSIAAIMSGTEWNTPRRIALLVRSESRLCGPGDDRLRTQSAANKWKTRYQRVCGIWKDSAVSDEATLAPLVRGDLDTVSFVRDYVEVRMDYNIVRCMTGPIVRSASGDYRFPESGLRDVLCGLIDSVITRVEINDDAIELHMDSAIW